MDDINLKQMLFLNDGLFKNKQPVKTHETLQPLARISILASEILIVNAR